MTFDTIVGNPPYQQNVGVQKEDYSMPIYQFFVDASKQLNPRFLSLIIPARWFAGGRGLDEFRSEMLHDDRLRIIHDYPDSQDCFPSVTIQAGVCYFLWDSEYHGDCTIQAHMGKESDKPLTRPLLEKGCSTFIRHNRAISILKKVQAQGEASFDKLVSPQTPFGLITSYKGTKTPKNPSDLKMYISGRDAEHQGATAFTPLSSIKKGEEMIPWHKVYIGEAYGGGMKFPHKVLSTPFYGEPNTVCNQSYLVLGPFKNKKTCENVISYIKTRFFRFLILQKKNAQHAMRGVYQFVPLQDFSEGWDDEKLYAKYGITAAERKFIEEMIRPMA